MSLEVGTRRDIAVIRAVRAAVGPGARLMVDANNGYNVNLAKRVLSETATDEIYWLEEPFHEDARLYAHLKEWFATQGLKTLIADGEGEASRNLVDWAKQGLVDVVQYDIFGLGLARWMELGSQLDGWHVRSGPHHYGEPTGNYYAAHLSAAIQGFEAVEWDEATLPGVDATGYVLAEGYVRVPDRPGFGLQLDEAYFTRVVTESGFTIEDER
jgi:L-rhamnonate dehydratase